MFPSPEHVAQLDRLCEDLRELAKRFPKYSPALILGKGLQQHPPPGRSSPKNLLNQIPAKYGSIPILCSSWSEKGKRLSVDRVVLVFGRSYPRLQKRNADEEANGHLDRVAAKL